MQELWRRKRQSVLAELRESKNWPPKGPAGSGSGRTLLGAPRESSHEPATAAWAASLAGLPAPPRLLLQAAACQKLKEEEQTAEGKESCSLIHTGQIRAKLSPSEQKEIQLTLTGFQFLKTCVVLGFISLYLLLFPPPGSLLFCI